MAIHNIYKFLIADDTNTKEQLERTLANARWFVSNVPGTEFYDINRYFWILLDKASSINITITNQNIDSFITLYLKTAIAECNVRIEGTIELNLKDPVDLEKAFRIVSSAMHTELEVLNATEPEGKSFDVVALEFFADRKRSILIDAYTKGMQILETGYRNLHGSSSSLDYVQQALAKANYLYNDQRIEMLSKKSNVKFKPKLLLKTNIPELDEDTLGLYTGQLWGIEAASGAGKTRFALGIFTYNALMSGYNVLYCALEQTTAEIEAMLLARHVFEMFGHHVEDKLIFRDAVPAKLCEEVANARYDLFQSGKYGKIYVHENMIYDNTIVDDLSTLASFQGPFDLYIIDHMYLIEHKSSKYEPYLAKHDIIANAYRYLKRYVKNQHYAVIAVNQLNKTGMEYVSADKCPPQDGAAGGIEVYRNTDYNIVLARTEAMKAQRKMRIFIPKVRSSAGNISPILDTQLWNCYFTATQQNTI